MSSSLDQQQQLRHRRPASATPSSAQEEPKEAAAAPQAESWTWAEFRQLCARTTAILVVFTVLHMVVQAYVLDPLAGKRSPMSEAEIRQFARAQL